jgi:hypothetical protein
MYTTVNEQGLLNNYANEPDLSTLSTLHLSSAVIMHVWARSLPYSLPLSF